MTDATQLFELAQLAEASYALLEGAKGNQNLLITRLMDKGFSTSQATELAKNWTVVDHQPNTASGYSGTLFKYIGIDLNSGFTNGQLVFAQRGTSLASLIFFKLTLTSLSSMVLPIVKLLTCITIGNALAIQLALLSAKPIW